MKNLTCLYISISGNTRSFMHRLVAYADQMHTINPDEAPTISIKEISDATLPAHEDTPFFVFVPTYLDGGNGITSGTTEIMTNALGEYIHDGDNAKLVMGVIGSGNKNFNEQYCLTARQYAQAFDAPFIADYELRGTEQDLANVYHQMITASKYYKYLQA